MNIHLKYRQTGEAIDLLLIPNSDNFIPKKQFYCDKTKNIATDRVNINLIIYLC